MPTYDYKCLNCGYVFEAFHKISDAPLADCPKCKGKLKRLISAGASFIFKGSGFYANDYKKRGTPKEKKVRPSGESSCNVKSETCKNCPQAKNKESSS